MKEVRAVVVALLILVVIAIAVAFWRRPARELTRVRGYRVEIEKNEGGSRKHVSFTVPITLVARIASFVPFADIGADARSNRSLGRRSRGGDRRAGRLGQDGARARPAVAGGKSFGTEAPFTA